MRAFVSILGMITSLAATVPAVQAGGLERLGTVGAQELRIPVGPASVAIGGSAVAMSNGLKNIFYNPASLAATDQGEVMVGFSSYLAESKMNYAAASARLGQAGSIAVSMKVLNVGDITVTTEDVPEGTGEIISPTFSVLGITYARRMTDRVLLGLTTMYVNERIAEAGATGFAVDLGVQYDTGWRGLQLGFAIKNVGPTMRFDGPDFERVTALPGADPDGRVIKLEATEFEIPSYLQFGVAYDLQRNGESRGTLYATYQGNNFSTDEYRVGGEYHLGNSLALRAGFVGQAPLDSEARQPDYLYSYTYGAGFNFRLGDRPVSLDWAGTHVGDFFGDNQQVSLSVAY
jgi:hypothetical protein